MGAGPVDRRVIVFALAVPAVTLVAIFAVTVLGGGDETADRAPTTTTTSTSSMVAVDEDWNAALADALAPLQAALPRYARDVDAWSTGDVSAADLTATLDDVEAAFAEVHDALDGLEEHPDDALARPLVARSARLYLAAVRSHRRALATDAAVAVQYDRLGRRLRILGDRVFDRARERTALPIDPGEGVELVRPAEVPDWTRLGVAVGPPLEREDMNVHDALPLERVAQRASQSEAEWRAAVDQLDVPGAEAVRAARGDGDALAAIARRLVTAAEALRSVAVPEDDRGRADRLALGWLVLADAARAAQLAAMTGDGDALVDALLEVAAGDALGAG